MELINDEELDVSPDDNSTYIPSENVIEFINEQKKSIDSNIEGGNKYENIQEWAYSWVDTAFGANEFSEKDKEYIRGKAREYIQAKQPQEQPVTEQPLEQPVTEQLHVTASPCDVLYDPCLGTPIKDENPLKVIQKKLHELQVAKRQAHLKELPVELLGDKKRLDLLIWFCNQDFQSIDEDSLLNYKKGSNQFSTSLFESYWDIVVALRLLSPFDAVGERYLLDRKVETLNTIDPSSQAFKGSFSKDQRHIGNLVYKN